MQTLMEDKDGACIGTLCFGNYVLTPPFQGSVFIEELAVMGEHRNKGFGTMLVQQLVNYCKENKI